MLAEYDREARPAQRTAVALAIDVRHASVDDDAATMRLLADVRMVRGCLRTMRIYGSNNILKRSFLELVLLSLGLIVNFLKFYKQYLN